MNAVAILNTQFVQVALPIIIALTLAAWLNGKNFDIMGKRIDDLGKRIDDLGKRIDDLKFEFGRRLERIEAKLDSHEDRITRLEERTSLVRK